eukprot:scaffold15336_cov21-Tisochrysis_lutea.AAC.1
MRMRSLPSSSSEEVIGAYTSYFAHLLLAAFLHLTCVLCALSSFWCRSGRQLLQGLKGSKWGK